ncbi:MAG: hydrogenase nickel incorporation protein HypA [Candidatus Methanogranum gryphiswaldense]|nr:MAG: hydrogenase nickel incorporation protein HypA [Candidatus Methanogranum sp. U3.2.1]
MTEENHEKVHDANCHCHECEEKGKKEKTSIEEAGGVVVGFTGHIHGYNADVEARLDKAMMHIGEFVQKESGSLLGHIKMAIYLEDGKGVTLSLTRLENGVDHHGVLEPCEKVDFNMMAAVLDVDKHELEHTMMHALDDTGIDYHVEAGHHHHDEECHDHDDGDKCSCHDHDHHHDDEECHCHDHHHHHDDEKCDCHDHDDGECHCKACEQHRKEEAESVNKPKKSFFSKFRRKTE